MASAPACYGYLHILQAYRAIWRRFSLTVPASHIGRFVINHSFILPGLIGVGVSCVFETDLRPRCTGSYNALRATARDYAAPFSNNDTGYRLEAMSNKPFIYGAPFPMGKDNAGYYLSLPIR
ncbi:hypothetical protein MJ581_24135 [Escherichia coli]|nr:hypothetical protein MJ581_24135 [Escherichia coli]